MLLTGGMPGNKGGTGRPPDKFKEMCRDLSSSADVYREVQKILKRGSKDPCFLGALKWASENGYGRPEQSLDVTSKGGAITFAALVIGSMDKKPA